MPKTATPRKPETVSRNLAETRNTSKNRSLSSLLGIGDNEKRLVTDLGSGLNDVIGRGTIAGLLGLPGDLGGAAENGLRSLLGLPQVVPYGGSEHIGQKMEQAGLVSSVRRPKTELLASLISPAQAATAGYKAPQMARAGVKALDNLSAPRTMGRQQGAIENLWHGSPHTFDRFDLSKIGTGEGAQAYGHGAYLAESPDVAKSYQKDLSTKVHVDGNPLLINNKRLGTTGNQDIDDYLIANHGDYDAALKHATDDMDSLPDDVKWQMDSVVNGLKSLSGRVDTVMDGNLYQTRLAWPDAREATDPLSPDHFLHWDKPLSEQSKFVRNTILESDLAKKVAAEQGIQDLNYIGARHFESPENSAGLRDLGIPGIRYLDGGSRGAGAGSHNYVVFDDKLIDIVSRNGQPVGNLGKMVAPQDEALRVAQANAAKPVSEGGLGLRPDNTPEERAAAMGFVREYPSSSRQKPEDMPLGVFYHGTNKPITEFSTSRIGNANDQFLGDYTTERYGTFMAENPDFSATFATNDGKVGANIMPLMYRSEKPAYLNSSDFYDEIKPQLIGAGYSESGINYTSQNPETIWESFDGNDKLFNTLRNSGYDSADMVEPWADGVGGLADVRMVLDPRNIRSRFAAFDPMRRDSSDLLAGLAPFGAVPWLRDEEP